MSEPMPDAALRAELVAMAREDLRVRAELAAAGSLFHGYHPEMRAVHDRHAARLAEILAAGGWPGERRVGADGAEAAWLVIQHAIAQPTIQRQALGALRAAAERGDVPAWQPAMLEDRIRTMEGRPQRYGTQLDWDETGRLNALPIEEPDGLAARRRALGLQPLEQVLEARRRTAALEGERAPADWHARQREKEEWLRQTGWRS